MTQPVARPARAVTGHSVRLRLLASAALLMGLSWFPTWQGAPRKGLPAPSSAAPVPRSPPPPARNGGLQARWRSWKDSYSGGRCSEADLAARFESLAKEDPRGLFEQLGAERDPSLRRGLRRLALLLWAEVDSSGAALAAETLPNAERADGAAAVLAGAAARPDEALALGKALCRRDSLLYAEHGYSLVAALGSVGRFDLAVRFALDDRDAADEETRSKWLKDAFSRWAAAEPASALDALLRLPEANLRFEALDSYASGRLSANPAGLAETLRALPEGPERNLVLGQTLRDWTGADPVAASVWLERQAPSEILDPGLAAVAAAASRANRTPEAALSWAESIADPGLRSRTLGSVLREWSGRDPSGALRYLKTSADLLPEDREEIVSLLGIVERH